MSLHRIIRSKQCLVSSSQQERRNRKRAATGRRPEIRGRRSTSHEGLGVLQTASSAINSLCRSTIWFCTWLQSTKSMRPGRTSTKEERDSSPRVHPETESNQTKTAENTGHRTPDNIVVIVREALSSASSATFGGTRTASVAFVNSPPGGFSALKW